MTSAAERSLSNDDSRAHQTLPGPKVAVVIACYNDSTFVAEAIASVHAQTFEEWECIVVDDGSVDDSVRVIELAISEDSRFRLIRHESNLGLPSARNTGIRSSTADLIAFLDADDLLLTRSLEDRVGSLTAQDNDGVAGVYAGVRYGTMEASLDSMPSSYRSGPSETIDFISADGECPFPVHSPLTKRPVIEAVGLFDESMTSGAEDWDLWYRILRRGYIFVPATLTSAVYRFKADGMTRSSTQNHVVQSVRLITAAHSGGLIVETPPGSPRPLSKPLAEYRRQISVADRGLRFAAMALLDGHHEEAREIVAMLGITDWFVVLRHIDLAFSVRRAASRTGRDNLDPSHESKILELLRSAIKAADGDGLESRNVGSEHRDAIPIIPPDLIDT